MKTKIFGYKIKIVIVLLIMSISWPLPAIADIGGGSGLPISPYSRYEAEVSESDVIEIKQSASQARKVADLKVQGTHIPRYGKQVGLMYLSNERVLGVPFFEFKGINELGDEIAIDFNIVKSFSLIAVEKRWFRKDRAQIEVIIFPIISPKELLETKPSYTELEEKYTKRVRLWVNLEDEGKGELCVVGKSWENKYEVLSRLRDIEPSAEVFLGYGRIPSGEFRFQPIWWAIDSVVEDSRYPYRLYPAAR